MKRNMHVSKSVQAAALCMAGMMGALSARGALGEVAWSVEGGAVFTFADSSAALTGRQQCALRVNGERARLDPQGYVRCGTAGTKLTLK